MARHWVSSALFDNGLRIMKPHEEDRQIKKNLASRPPILVMGVGNILLCDEGVGVRVIEAMQSMTVPDNVELLDGGTASMALVDSLNNREKVILIDAVRGGNNPGTLYRFMPDEIKIGKHMLSSLHDIGLLEAFGMAQYLGGVPQNIIIYGIEPKEIAWGLDLSPEVAAVVPRVIELVLSELRR